MNLPNLPTDNLYKFLALSGVVLCIACFVLSTITTQNFSSQRVAVLTDLAEIQKDLEAIDINDSDVPASLREISVVSERIRIKQTEVKDMNAIYATTSENLKHGIQIGLVASIVGFILWYLNVQRHEDKILRAKVPLAPKRTKKRQSTKSSGRQTTG